MGVVCLPDRHHRFLRSDLDGSINSLEARDRTTAPGMPWVLIVRWALKGLPLSLCRASLKAAPSPFIRLLTSDRKCIQSKAPCFLVVPAFRPIKLGPENPPQCWPLLDLGTTLIFDELPNTRDHTGARPFCYIYTRMKLPNLSSLLCSLQIWVYSSYLSQTCEHLRTAS